MGVSHDRINRYLRRDKLTPRLLWDNVKPLLQRSENAYVLFDDTVLDKRYSTSIELTRRQYKGVQAQALLKVRLDNVATIIERTLTTIDRNPQFLERLLQSVDRTVGIAGNVANTAVQPGGVVDCTVGTVGQTVNNATQPGGLLSQTVNTLGQTVQTTVDSTGKIIQSTTDNTGKVLNQRTLGDLKNLQVLNETRNKFGQIVRSVRDRSGAIIEYTLDSSDKIINPRVV